MAESPARGGKNIGRGGALAEPLCNGTHHPASPVRGGRYSCQAEFLPTGYHRFGKISFFEDNTDNENNNFILTICLVLSTSINCLYCSYCLLNQKNQCVLCILCEIKKTTQTTSTTHIMLITFWEDNTDNENNNFILTICLVLSTSINCLYCSYCLLNQKNQCKSV